MLTLHRNAGPPRMEEQANDRHETWHGVRIRRCAEPDVLYAWDEVSMLPHLLLLYAEASTQKHMLIQSNRMLFGDAKETCDAIQQALKIKHQAAMHV